jgi:hypothetical protein
MAIHGYRPIYDIKNITITPEMLKLVADIDEFKGHWKVMETLAPERLASLMPQVVKSVALAQSACAKQWDHDQTFLPWAVDSPTPRTRKLFPVPLRLGPG